MVVPIVADARASPTAFQHPLVHDAGMARPLRLEFEGALYHVTGRGNARAAVYEDDADRQYFLDLLWGTVARRAWLCHAYCLMGNHYHLVAARAGRKKAKVALARKLGPARPLVAARGDVRLVSRRRRHRSAGAACPAGTRVQVTARGQTWAQHHGQDVAAPHLRTP